MEQQTTPTAAQRALATPEIVANIFKHLTQERWIASFFGGPKIFYDRKWLHPCSLVNSLWCAEAMRYLWEYPTTGRIISLDECLARVHPDHRQFYASFVRRAKVTSAHPADFSQRSTIMSDLAFPRLRCLALCIEESRDQTLLSWPHAPNVEELFIQPILQIYPGGQVENFNNWGKTLPERTLINLPEHIKDRYPKIKRFGIGIEISAARKTVDEILKLLPENEIQCVCVKGTHDTRSPVHLVEY